MANIIAQIIITLNLLLGQGNHTAQASQIYNNNAYTSCNGGIVIIDTDEL